MSLLVAALACAPGTPRADTLPPLYHPVGQDAWDFWFTHDGGAWQCYYLQCPVDYQPEFGYSTIGLATSPDLVHWTEYGQLIAENPPGSWNDVKVATGSTWRNGGEWDMLFTAQTSDTLPTVGRATSPDFMHWSRAGDGPVPLHYNAYPVPDDPAWAYFGLFPGMYVSYLLLADPWVLPEPIDGWYYMVANTVINRVYPDRRGAVSLWRSQDGAEWTAVGILAAPLYYSEMEVPQLWKHGERWYLLFGGARWTEPKRQTVLYISDSMTGPFEPAPNPVITLPGWSGWFYGAKVFPGPDGRDVLLGAVGGVLSRPYPVEYGADGSITLLPFDDVPPAPPALVSGTWEPGVGTHLAWAAPPDTDVDHYAVYRGVPGFTPSDSSRVATTPDLGWIDAASAAGAASYAVSAVDHFGNESPAAPLAAGEVAGVPSVAGGAIELAAPSPNPARTRVALAFAAPAGRVSLAIYDLSGRRVRTLADGAIAAGRSRVVWDLADDRGRAVGAGVYFARLEAAGVERVRRIAIAR